MGLSNTATPKYYGQFREAVLRGEIPVCNEISMEMNRIDELIRNPNYYYNDKAVEGWIRFCENELTLTDGSAVNMLDSFKLWGEQLLGWYQYVDRSVYVPGEDGHGGHYERRKVRRRLTVKQYLIVARGGAKSMYAYFIQAYFLVINTATSHQITTAPTMKQAEEVMTPFRTAITRAPGPFFKFLTSGNVRNTSGDAALRQKLASTKVGIQNFMTGSLLEVRPMSINKLQGLRPVVATIDEWLSGDIREDVVGAIEQGASKGNTEYLLVAISSEGTVRNGPGDSIKMELMEMLKGEYYAPHVSVFYYRLDSLEEVPRPEMWAKAQPNIGKTVSYEVYQQEVERAEKVPSARNDILAKRFGIPAEGFTYFFTYEETLPHRPQSFWQMRSSLGIDLSQGDDFTAFTFLFPLQNGRYGVVTRCYVTELTMSKLSKAMRDKYDEFVAEGSLIVIPGNILDLEEVYEDLIAFIDAQGYDIRSVGYDPYNAKGFMDSWVKQNSAYGVEKVQQGMRTETVPLGELKTLAEERALLFSQSLMSFAMGNAVVKEDTDGNRKLLKRRYDEKIDPVSALLDAWVAHKLNKDNYE